MGFKDLLKNVSDFAQDGIDSIQEEIALKKEEQQRLREEMNQRINHYRAEIMEKLLAKTQDQPLILDNASVVTAFTDSFYHDLYLPASNASHSQLSFYPEYDTTMKEFSKLFSNFTNQEQFLMCYKGPKEQTLLLSTSTLYFKIVFPENNAFYCIGQLDLKDLYQFDIQKFDDSIHFLINDLALITVKEENLLTNDLLSLENYLSRLANRDFVITPNQIHQFILTKLNAKTIQILQEHLDPTESLLYFAWGLNSINSNKFVACTDKKIFLYDHEINLSKYFYYSDITSITTQASTINLLDLSLSIGTNPNDLTIKSSEKDQTISILYAKEAKNVIAIYQKFSEPTPIKESPISEASLDASKSQEDPLALLEKLAQLKEAGVLSESEFKAKKADLLSRL